MAPKDKSYTMAEYFPCYGQYTNNVKYFVPITRQQRVVMKDILKRLPDEEMLMEEWNSLLESLLKANGFAAPLVFSSFNITDPKE